MNYFLFIGYLWQCICNPFPLIIITCWCVAFNDVIRTVYDKFVSCGSLWLRFHHNAGYRDATFNQVAHFLSHDLRIAFELCIKSHHKKNKLFFPTFLFKQIESNQSIDTDGNEDGIELL